MRELRPERDPIDPWRPLGVVRESEHERGGSREETLTIFLAGMECPFSCVFCDLWRHTLPGRTPPGALPRQLEAALSGEASGPHADRVKLYNASNFFHPGAVPPEDDEPIARLLDGIAAVTVECHPKLLGDRCLRFAELLEGRLEVALGLETAHPQALASLGKEMSLDDFDRAADWLRRHDLDLRVFVLVGVPGVPAEEQVEWAARSAGHALDRGARRVALIPVRGGNGALEELAASGGFAPPTLQQIESALSRALAETAGTVTADLWDLDRFADCPACLPARRHRLETINRTGLTEPPVSCPECGGGPV
ncbi:MAG: radical SAM protein [Thermoanaerobaculia bacterium]